MGGLLTGNIRQAGKEESWVHRALLRQGYREERDVLLALWDGGEKLTVFPMGALRAQGADGAAVGLNRVPNA